MKETIYDPDPIINEIHKTRRKILRKYKTLDAYFAHLDTIPSAAELIKQIDKKIARRDKMRTKRKTTTKKKC